METAIVPLPQRIRAQLEIRREDLESILPEWMTYKRFMNMSLMAIARTPKLADCDFSSIYLSLMECARLGLYPDGRQAAIVPYKGKATLLPMVQGIIELMLRAPKVTKVESRVVYYGDFFEYSYGLNSRLDHVPINDETDFRQIIASYAIVFWEHTEPTFEVVIRDDLVKARQSSAAPNGPAWVTWEGEQSRKVAVKRLSKYVDLTPEAQLLIEWDHEIYGDPAMEGSVEGSSAAYKNQHVKAETEAKLEALKEKIEPKDNGDEPREEQGTKEDHERERKELANADLPHEPDPEPEIIEETVIEAPPRMENQWEETIFHFIIDGGFVRGDNKIQMERRLAAILNASPFFDLPFGELKLVPALAWVFAWEQIKEKHSKMKVENRKLLVLKLWEERHDELIDLAANKIPPDLSNG